MGIISRVKEWRKERRLLNDYASACMQSEQAAMNGNWEMARMHHERAGRIESELSGKALS